VLQEGVIEEQGSSREADIVADGARDRLRHKPNVSLGQNPPAVGSCPSQAEELSCCCSSHFRTQGAFCSTAPAMAQSV
jgi:hypothetical protein